MDEETPNPDNHINLTNKPLDFSPPSLGDIFILNNKVYECTTTDWDREADIIVYTYSKDINDRL